MSAELSPVEVEAGQVYETETGIRVRVEEVVRDSKPLVVSKSDREGTERMSRFSFADMVNYEGMTRVEDAPAEEDPEDEDDHVRGEFDGPIRCPECGSFMSTGYDPAGFPHASCPRRSCEFDGYPDDELRARGLWSEE